MFVDVSSPDPWLIGSIERSRNRPVLTRRVKLQLKEQGSDLRVKH